MASNCKENILQMFNINKQLCLKVNTSFLCAFHLFTHRDREVGTEIMIRLKKSDTLEYMMY